MSSIRLAAETLQPIIERGIEVTLNTSGVLAPAYTRSMLQKPESRNLLKNITFGAILQTNDNDPSRRASDITHQVITQFAQGERVNNDGLFIENRLKEEGKKRVASIVSNKVSTTPELKKIIGKAIITTGQIKTNAPSKNEIIAGISDTLQTSGVQPDQAIQQAAQVEQMLGFYHPLTNQPNLTMENVNESITRTLRFTYLPPASISSVATPPDIQLAMIAYTTKQKLENAKLGLEDTTIPYSTKLSVTAFGPISTFSAAHGYNNEQFYNQVTKQLSSPQIIDAQRTRDRIRLEHSEASHQHLDFPTRSRGIAGFFQDIFRNIFSRGRPSQLRSSPARILNILNLGSTIGSRSKGGFSLARLLTSPGRVFLSQGSKSVGSSFSIFARKSLLSIGSSLKVAAGNFAKGAVATVARTSLSAALAAGGSYALIAIVAIFAVVLIFNIVNTPKTASQLIPIGQGGGLGGGLLPNYTGPIIPGCPQIWPVSSGYRINQGPGGSYSHSNAEAIDIGTPVGTEVVSVQSGKVIFAGWGVGSNSSYGNLIIIQSKLDDGTAYQHWYAHLSVIYVATGQNVDAGRVIALSGGTSSNPLYRVPHLHFEYRLISYSQCPLPGIPASELYSCSGYSDCNYLVP